MKRLVFLLACVLAFEIGAQESEASFDLTQSQHSGSTGPGRPAAQSSTAQARGQIALVARAQPAPEWQFSTVLWVGAANLPSGIVTEIPEYKIVVESNVLEALVHWEPWAGVLSFDAGKKVFHASSGFSAAPLNWFDRGKSKSGARSTSRWEEGWIETSVTWFAPFATISNAYIPAVDWNDDADRTLRSLSSRQIDAADLVRVSANLFGFDVQSLGWIDAQGVRRVGIGVDAGVSDAVTLRGEVSAAREATIESLVGATWSLGSTSTIMGEYSWKSAEGKNAHHGFLRGAGTLEEKTDGEIWALVNLLDASGVFGASIAYDFDRSRAQFSFENAWGSPGSEFGSSPYLWKIELEYRLFL